MAGTVVIDAFPESAARYTKGYAIVAIDVIRATTTALTALATGRRCFVVSSTTDAFRLRETFKDALLAGEVGGVMPPGFEINNSPAEVASRADTWRPMILLSSSGTRLIKEAALSDAVFLACFRNYSATARYLAGAGFRKIAVIGAGSQDEFREEDQMCCAWIAARLLNAGYRPQDENTAGVTQRWLHTNPSAILSSRSVEYLRRTGQTADLKFVLSRIDDVRTVAMASGGEVRAAPRYQRRKAA